MGNVVMASAILYNKCSMGIEISQNRYDFAVKFLEAEKESAQTSGNQEILDRLGKVKFIHENAANIDCL
jgi:hypothetical protein